MFGRTPQPSSVAELTPVEPRAVAQAVGLSKVYGSGQATVTALDERLRRDGRPGRISPKR
jgi:hypothetical protein